MKKYAMVLANENLVIDVVEGSSPPQYPPTYDGVEILSVELNQEDEVNLGHIYDPFTKSFCQKESYNIPEHDYLNPLSLNPISNEVIAQMISQLYAELLIAGVIK